MNSEDEELRLSRLYQYNLLDTPEDDTFDRITRLVSALLDVPIALITLVDRDRQWFKSKQGLGISETPRSQSFCAHTMIGQGPMVVQDASLDARFVDNPLVTGHPGIRFYAGIPLRAADGTPLGALCAIDSSPREIDSRQLKLLADLANLTMEQFELRLLATLDGLTGAMRRSSFLATAARDMVPALQRGSPLSCLMIDADNFKNLNDQFGHAVGDEALVAIAKAIRDQLRRGDSLGRMGGEEFCVFLPGTELSGAISVAERMRMAIADISLQTGTGDVGVTASIGAAVMLSTDSGPSDLIQRADVALYDAKNSGRNRVAA
ncbi:sensor domain-containing diguanylate cyclase [Devosia sp. XJ19-1]|uniref:Sensor domain-containing diguanylate cyclase n=1 Tax=Devosia ureilytica TaxID=2952754 RepID=A0A9Q4AS95_9HYPH|nr:sensor domain-containing diguanylate cyclase [Devosia ureilytica]MCP8888930.1 sensor domain-containing diguanylate cyclase [Devosia ureilytica]